MIIGDGAPTADGLAVARLCRGDGRALAELHDRYSRLAFAVALRVTRDAALAEDAVQDAFLGVWRNAATYSTEAGSARTWLLAIVRHRAIDIVRRRKAGLHSELPEATEAAARPGDRWVAPDLWPAVERRLETAEIQGALGALPPLQRQVIELAYFRGYTQVEIAAATGAPLGTVKSRVRCALVALRNELDGSAPPSPARRAAAPHDEPASPDRERAQGPRGGRPTPGHPAVLVGQRDCELGAAPRPAPVPSNPSGAPRP